MCLDVRVGHFRGVTEEGTPSNLEKYPYETYVPVAAWVLFSASVLKLFGAFSPRLSNYKCM